MTHYSRAETGLRAPKGRYFLDRADVEGIALHWPAMAAPLTNPPAVMAALRTWQRYHMDSKGWSDIAYQVAVDQAGNTYRLRGLRYRSGANGDLDVNQRYGALLLVLAPGEEPTQKLIRAVQGRVAAFRRIFPGAVEIKGHGDVRPEPTACPGPAVTRLIRTGAFEPPRKDPTHHG
jgi:hypothetical protein